MSPVAGRKITLVTALRNRRLTAKHFAYGKVTSPKGGAPTQKALLVCKEQSSEECFVLTWTHQASLQSLHGINLDRGEATLFTTLNRKMELPAFKTSIGIHMYQGTLEDST